MQILCIFILWIHLNDAGAAIEVSDFNTSKAKIVDEHAAKLIISKKEFLQKLLRSKECEKKSWYCNKSCYWEPQFFTEAMRHKFLAVNANTMACFGNNITYNFTAEVSNATIEHFSLIKNFPICWNSLAPFICDTHFRPWKGISYEVHGEPNELKHSNVMKIYSMKSCRNVRENCIFLKDYGINLKNLDCEGRSTALGLFETPSSALRKRRLLFSTEDCRIENSSNMNFTKAACLEPLVEVKNITNHNDSIIDSCYLGCRTSFAKKHQVDFLRFSILAFSIILAFAFLFAAAYTSRISFGYEQKIRKIFIQLMFGNSGILNLFMVVILVTPSLFETCTDINNTLIRAELEGDFNSCTISWVVLTFLLSASFVSFSLFMCQWILKPLGLPTSLEQWSNENKAAGKAITIFMCFFVYGCAFAMSIINLSFKAKVPGGMVNMCYILLDPITSNQIFYNFLFCMAIVVCLALSLRLLPALINLSKKCLNSEVQEEATEQPDQQNSTTNNHNLKAIVWKVIFCTIPLAIFVMFKMNSWFSFDQYHERLEIDQKIRCVLNQIKRFENESETSFIETECTFPSASNWDLLYFFTYAFVLPMFPFMVTFFATFFGQNALGIHKKNGWTDMKQLVIPEDKSCLLSNVAGLIEEETPCSFPKVPRSNTSRAKSLPVSINGYEKKYPYKSMGLRKKRTPESSINVGQEDHPVLNIGVGNDNFVVSRAQYNAMCTLQAIWTQYQQGMQLPPILENATLPNEEARMRSTQTLQSQDSQQSSQRDNDSDDFDSDESAKSDEKRALGIKADSSSDELPSDQSSSDESEEDSAEKQRNPIIYEIGMYLKNNEVESKMQFYMLVLEKFQTLFENHPKFKTMCTTFLTADPQNPERNATAEGHIITKEEMILLTNELKLDKDVKRLCKLAIDQAVSDFKSNNIP